VVLLLDEIEFLFDPLASVRHCEFQSASSPAATAATLQGKKRGRRNEGIQLAMYTRQCGRDRGYVRTWVCVKTVRGTRTRDE